jgi:AraC family transcriptional regulator
MVPYRIVERPAFRIAGKQTYISGPENSQFGQFWELCREGKLFDHFRELSNLSPGPQTGGVMLGVSRVEQDPARRDFDYMIAIELSETLDATDPRLEGLEIATVPAATWAIFDAHGPLPDAIVTAEMYAFGEWLPGSGYIHARAPEMEVYLPGDALCEFWLPVAPGKQP